MDTMNVVLAADRDGETGRITQLLVGVADRATRNWLSPPEVMSATHVTRCIQAGQRFETFYIGEAGPVLTVARMADGVDEVVAVDGDDGPIRLADLPPCGNGGQRHTYRLGRESSRSRRSPEIC